MHHSLQIPISRLVPLGKPCDPGRHDRGAPKALLPGRRRRHRCQGARISPGFPPDFPGISPGKLLHGPRRCPGDPLLVPLSPGSAPQPSPQLCGISARRWEGATSHRGLRARLEDRGERLPLPPGSLVPRGMRVGSDTAPPPGSAEHREERPGGIFVGDSYKPMESWGEGGREGEPARESAKPVLERQSSALEAGNCILPR